MAVHAALIAWGPEAAAALGRASTSEGDLIDWQQDVTEGTAQLWRIGGESVGYLLTRVETYANDADELVLVAAAGVNGRPVIEWAMKLAANYGIESIRTHIKRPGLQRIYERLGWHCAERVMRVFSDGR